MLQGQPTASALPSVRSLAIRSLARQPVNPEAARFLGLAAAAANQPARADKLMTYAEAMSRRDLPAQLFLIERHVERDDIAGALRHYDRAMSTRPASWAILFPILNGATDTAAVWQPLAEYLAQRRPWARPFLEQFVPQATAPGALVAIARRMGLDRAPSPDLAMLQAIQQRLVVLKAYRAAAELYDRAQGRTGADGALLRNGGFEQPGGWQPFDWNLIDEPDLRAERQPSPAGRGHALFLSAANGRGGDVAVQHIILPAGVWQARARVGAIAGDKLAFPQMIVRCAADGREFLHQTLSAAPAGGVAWTASFTVPADCPAEQIVLRVRSPFDPQDAAPWIDDITLYREGALK